MEKVNGKWIAPEHFDSEEERKKAMNGWRRRYYDCLLYTSPSPRDRNVSRMPSSA